MSTSIETKFSKVYQHATTFFFHQLNSHEKFAVILFIFHSFHGHSKNFCQNLLSCGQKLRWGEAMLLQIEQKNISYYAILRCFFITGTNICFSRQELLVGNDIYFQQFQHDNINSPASPCFSLQSLFTSMQSV